MPQHLKKLSEEITKTFAQKNSVDILALSKKSLGALKAKECNEIYRCLKQAKKQLYSKELCNKESAL